MTSIITYLKYHVFNFLLDPKYQDFNASTKIHGMFSMTD